MKRRTIVNVFLVALVATVTTPALAIDVVMRISTKVSPQGQVTEITRTSVTIKSKIKGAVTIPANDIDRIRWDGEPAQLNIARSVEAGGRPDEALKSYQQYSNKVSKANIKNDIQFLIARATARIALTDPSKQDEAIQKLGAFIKSHGDNFHYFEAVHFLGQVYMAKQDYAKAKSTFDSLAKAPWNDYKMAAQSANARLLLMQDDLDGALKAFDAVAKAPAKEPAELSRRYEAMIGKSTCLTRQKKFDEAINTIDSIIDQTSADDTRVLAEAYVRKGDCLRESKKPKEAVLAYLPVHVLFEKEQAFHAEALYHLARMAGGVGQPKIADDARAALQTDYANNEWTKKLTDGS